MKKFRAWLTIGFAGAEREEIFEYPDEANEEEIEEDIKEWAFNYIDWGFAPIEGGEDA
jgi:hypothetical protein